MQSRRSYCMKCRRNTPTVMRTFPEDREYEEICEVCGELKWVRRMRPEPNKFAKFIRERKKENRKNQ